MVTALLVIGILVFLIVVHELGHFVVAKLFRVRVEEFGIGYPPRALTLGKIGDTEYTLNWIPFGGFVRLFGDVGEGQRGKGSLVDSNRGVQAAILIAGVTMNAVAAWFLFALAFHAGIPRAVEAPSPGEHAQLIIADVVPGSPAETAGIRAGDEIVQLDAEDGSFLPKLTPQAFSDFVRERGGEAVRVTYLHLGATTTATLVPAHAVTPESTGRPAVGVALYLLSTRPLSWGDSLLAAGPATINAFRSVGSGLWGIVERTIAGNPNFSDVVGPIGLFGIVGDASDSGFGSVLTLAAFISVNLAIINLIPVPALDGGRLALLGVETLMRRQAPRLVLQLVNAFGVALIILLMVTVTFNDIARLIT